MHVPSCPVCAHTRGGAVERLAHLLFDCPARLNSWLSSYQLCCTIQLTVSPGRMHGERGCFATAWQQVLAVMQKHALCHTTACCQCQQHCPKSAAQLLLLLYQLPLCCHHLQLPVLLLLLLLLLSAAWQVICFCSCPCQTCLCPCSCCGSCPGFCAFCSSPFCASCSSPFCAFCSSPFSPSCAACAPVMQRYQARAERQRVWLDKRAGRGACQTIHVINTTLFVNTLSNHSYCTWLVAVTPRRKTRNAAVAGPSSSTYDATCCHTMRLAWPCCCLPFCHGTSIPLKQADKLTEHGS